MSTPQRPVGVAWAPEPAHWSELKPGDVIEQNGDRLAMVSGTGVTVAEPGDTDGVPGQGYRWLWTAEPDGHGNIVGQHRWARPDDPDPLALVLVRRDALVGQVTEGV